MMAGDCCKREMTLEIFHFVLVLLHIFQHYCSHVAAVESHSQAFIQTDNHLTYIVGDVHGINLEVNPGQGIDAGTDENFLSMRLDPPLLDFQEQPVGMPRMEQVLVQNTDPKNNLHLLSISGSTVHFHCSFFQDKSVPPGGNTTFDVVFLARQVGNVENTLFIHTSQGSFRYQVFGVGVQNPYRLRPYLGAKVPLNSSFAPVIHMHNPFSTTLQVLEMFSSEGDLHLELPTGEKEAPKNLWEIPPYETKPVMKANFIGRSENNHTAFIRIKTNLETNKDVLILPVEVEVSAIPGIYSPSEMIDFGILRTLDGPKTLPLNLINTGSRPIHITSITLSPPNDAVSIEFRPIKLQPDVVRSTTIAQITFKAEKAIHPKQWSGKIIVRSKNNQHKFVIPYQASVLHGSLAYNINNTYFFGILGLHNRTRVMTFTNTFNFSVVIYNVTISKDGRPYFSILNFTCPVMLKPQQSLAAFLIKFHPTDSQMHFRTLLTLYTNVSNFEIPIIVYNGLLKIIHHRPEKFKGQLDFGTLGVLEKRSLIFTVRNDNPVRVFIGDYRTDLKKATVELLGIEKGNGTILSRIYNKSELEEDPLILKPYHFAVFSLNVTAPDYEGIFLGELEIITPYEDIIIPVSLRTAEGSLNGIPEKIVFDRVYPGRVPYKVLQIHSTFEDYMEVTQVVFQPSDVRFYYEPPDEEHVILEPQENNIIGKIYFDAKKECRDDCYVGLPTHTPAGHQWLLGLSLDKEVADTDQYLFTRLQQKWEKIQNSELNTARVTIELDTNQVRGFLFSAQAHLHWPSLLRKCKIKFPLTQIGNISISDFIVENPGDVPVLIQVVPLPLYPNPQTIMDMVGQRLSSDLLSDYIETDDPDVFTLQDLEQFDTSPQNPVSGYRKHIESTLGVKPDKHTLTTILVPGVRVKVRVGFQPKDDISRTSLILIRNNLTIIDTIVVQGQGGRGEMKLNSKKPGSQSPLQFDMTEKHLKNCDKKKHAKNVVPNFTVRRSFSLKNTGELPFYVHGYSINDSPCEGYGFRVLDCEGFEMLPNTSKKIDIAFTPDFTMSRIRRMLTVYTSLGPPSNYSLQATVPPHTLSKCSAALPRPNWEPVLYYSIVCVMGFLLFCILVAAYFEADRIFVADILKRKIKVSSSTQTFDKAKIFDLNKLGLTSLANPLKPPPLAPDILAKPPKSVIELSNGHVVQEKPKKDSKKEPLSVTVINIIKSFFSQKKATTPKRPFVERPTLKEKETSPLQTASSFKPQSNDKQPLPHDSVISEKSIAPQKMKKKAAKRSHSSDLTSTENHINSGHNDKKQGNRDQTSLDPKKMLDQVGKPNMDKDQPNPRYFTRSVSLDGDYVGPPLMPDEPGIEDIPRYEGKTKNKKRNRNKIEKDFSLPRDRLSVRDSLDDRDETSSTTTESSNGEPEEKSSSARDSTPEPPPPKPKKTKNKTRQVSAVFGHAMEDDPNAGDFELTSKSKAHRRIRVNSKDTYGGDIMRPSTLELPYTLQTKELPYNPDTQVPDGRNSNGSVDATSRTKKQNKTKPGGDLSELALQTESFAQKQKALANNGHATGFSPDPLSSSSRSSSYSSIVSSSSNGETPGGKIKTKPEENRGFNVGFPAFGNTRIPGAIGSRSPPIKTTAVGTGSTRSVWSSGSGSPTTPNPISFGLQTIQENSGRPVGSGLPEGQMDSFTQSEFPFGNNVDSLYGFGGYNNQQTMMQRLREERLRRIREHQFKVMQGDDWPGFGTPPIRNESLWDNEYNPLDPINAWSRGTDSPPDVTENSLWSTLTNSANSGWNSLLSIWNSTPTSTAGGDGLPRDDSFSGSEGRNSPNSSGSQTAESVGAFNPFNLNSDIWGPNAPTTTSGWNLPPNKDGPDN